MNQSISRGAARDPNATVTLAQSEFLAPLVLAVAKPLSMAVQRLAGLFGRT
ncbi:MAG: hypothetical protein HQ481_07140 [Alphaproteobacteria bacterium]|nr:hypothetical protein [Alphaproteobacteria bacterium]